MSLLPEWLGIAWAGAFLAVAAAHVAHMLGASGQQRPWHACHVLIGLGMAAMYCPAEVNPLPSASVWQGLFAVAGVIAAVWAISGAGRVSTVIWFLTAVDLGAMVFMWSRGTHGDGTAVAWLLAVYCLAEAVLWTCDLYRRVDSDVPLISWRLLALESGLPEASARRADGPSRGLLSAREISASMIVMTLGMAYMLIAM